MNLSRVSFIFGAVIVALCVTGNSADNQYYQLHSAIEGVKTLIKDHPNMLNLVVQFNKSLEATLQRIFSNQPFTESPSTLKALLTAFIPNIFPGIIAEVQNDIATQESQSTSSAPQYGEQAPQTTRPASRGAPRSPQPSRAQSFPQPPRGEYGEQAPQTTRPASRGAPQFPQPSLGGSPQSSSAPPPSVNLNAPQYTQPSRGAATTYGDEDEGLYDEYGKQAPPTTQSGRSTAPQFPQPSLGGSPPPQLPGVFQPARGARPASRGGTQQQTGGVFQPARGGTQQQTGGEPGLPPPTRSTAGGSPQPSRGTPRTAGGESALNYLQYR